jgi:hypothetical protein
MRDATVACRPEVAGGWPAGTSHSQRQLGTPPGPFHTNSVPCFPDQKLAAAGKQRDGQDGIEVPWGRSRIKPRIDPQAIISEAKMSSHAPPRVVGAVGQSLTASDLFGRMLWR